MNENLLRMFLLALAATIGLAVLSANLTAVRLGEGDSILATFGLSLSAAVALIPVANSVGIRKEVRKLAFKGFQLRVLAICIVALVILPYYAARNSADASFYDTQALFVADQIRAGAWNQIQLHAGTEMVSFVTALLYLPFGPSAAGMTFLSGLLGFVGSLCFAGAAQVWLPLKSLKQYTIFVLMLPSIVFWSTLFGKDSWVFFGLGITALGVSQWLRNRRVSYMAKLLFGLGIASAFRPYVALVVLLGLAVAMVMARTKRISATSVVKSTFLLVLLVPAAVVMWQGVSRITGVTQLSEESIVDRISAQGTQTRTGGGSDVDTEQVQGTSGFITQLPAGAIRLFFRPFPWEATSFFMFVAALDNTALIVVLVVKRRNVLHTLKNIRSHPYCLFCLTLTIGLTAVFSTISNLGILMREKTQITPFLFFLAFATSDEPRRKSQIREKSTAATHKPDMTPVGMGRDHSA